MHLQTIDFINTWHSLIRDPHQHKLIHKLEMVQHRAAWFVLNKPWNKHYHNSISEMLHKLNWPSLQTKRKQARLIFLFKMLNKQISIPDQYLPSPFSVTATRSCYSLQLQQLYTRKDIYHFLFLPRTIPNWNNLCIEKINELDLTQFRYCLMKLSNWLYIIILVCYP